MVQPNLIHPVPVKLEQLDQSATEYDPDTREPIQHSSRASVVTLSGQVRWRSQFEKSVDDTGMAESADGYVMFRKLDLDNASITLKLNDRFAEIGGIETDVYINRLEWMGHYSDIGGPTLVRAYFEDRQPARQTRGT